MFGEKPYVSVTGLVCRHCGAINNGRKVETIYQDSIKYRFVLHCKWCNNIITHEESKKSLSKD